MSLIALAGRCGVTSRNLQDLINGVVSVGVAGRVGVVSSSLQEFVNGGTSVGLAGKLGMTSANLQLLRNQIGQEGAVGLIIGLMVSD